MDTKKAIILGAFSICFLFIILAYPHTSSAARYVSTSGTDSGDCTTPATPCATIQYGMDQLAGSETVNVAQGTYPDYFFLELYPPFNSISLIGGWNNDFTEREINPSATISYGDIIASWADVVIDGFTFKNSSIRAHYGFDIELSNNIFNKSELYFSGWFDPNVTATNNIITGNTVGISLITYGLRLPDGGCETSGDIYFTSINNTFTMNDIGLLTRVGYCGNSVIVDLKNDIIWGNNLDIDTSEGGTVNASYSNIGSGSFNDDGTNISEDPLFLDVTSGDFHISPYSQCVDGGTNTGAPAIDFEGNIRPFDGAGDGQAITDIGADEYSLIIFQTDNNPVIDGTLSEYDTAEGITITPPSGGNTVTIKAVWNNEALYLAYEVIDIELNGSITTRDGDAGSDDSVEWGIDTLGDSGGSGTPGSPYMLPDDYRGIINILNTQYDEQGTASGVPSSSWHGGWQSAVHVNGTINDNSDTDTGYTVEVKIPWSELGFSGPPANAQLLKIAFKINDKDSGCDVYPAGTYLDAENFTGTISQGSGTFSEESSLSGHLGTGYLLSVGGSGGYGGACPAADEGKEYLLNFPPTSTDTTYNVWIRGYAPDGNSDSVFIGIDGNCTGAIKEGVYNSWRWTNHVQNGVNTVTVPAGMESHRVNVWIREPNHLLDGIYITTGTETPSDAAHRTTVDPKSCLTTTSAMWPDGTGLFQNVSSWERTNLSTTCAQSIVRIFDTPPAYYSTLQSAYDSAVNSDLMQSRGLIFNGDLFIDMNKEVALSGGYSCDYSAHQGTTTIRGNLIIIDGALTIEDGIVRLREFFPVPDTGQTQSYTATIGEDSDYLINPPHFSDNGDGTVTDNVTGLMWWQDSDIQTYQNWYVAAGTHDSIYNPGLTDFCGNSTLAGYTDWRLPDEFELQGIANYGTSGPAIDENYFLNTSSHYWSSTTVVHRPTYARYVNYSDGRIFYKSKSDNSFVKCVRGEPDPSLSYTDNSDGTVTDNVTGLMWQQEDDSTERSWLSALTYCENLSLAAHTDWRLPNVKELVSIIDNSRYDPAINTTYFPNISYDDLSNTVYWSSTAYHPFTLAMWYVSFKSINVGVQNRSDTNFVRCVRGGQ